MNALFSDSFPPVDKAAWLAQIRRELKDENVYESLRWLTPDGFVAEPYYTSEDLITLPLDATQAAQKHSASPEGGNGWLNAPQKRISNPKTDNMILRNALRQGADALVLELPAEIDADSDTLTRLLNGIKLSDTPVFFRLDSPDQTQFIKALKLIAPYQLKGGLLMDTNNSTVEATRLTADSPLFRTICVSSSVFHNAGATATQELAFLLARLGDAYDQLTEAGLTTELLATKTLLSVSVGTSYFMEIAKLRVLRVLYSRFLQAYGQSAPAFVHAQTSTFYDARTTPYTNLLRATTEAMSAVVGGCDALTVHPYDRVLGQTSDFSERIARNVSSLLRDESYLDKVTDPSAGSYYIENLTHQLAEAAWGLFLNVEQQGGFKKALENGFIQHEIEQAYQARVEAVRHGKVLVGVTKFRSDDPAAPAQPAVQRLTNSLPDRRLPQEFE
ncbi:methylmalonyl-CoA mutase [Spirosoma taeanense]|uniref:Methylmalonyl-CoA mutase n=1 Tax=Spirosoma taeanense TaxID=2735870 RepID=A0A6M5Y5B7_9BACT|nr:methylmalonyl-CoA mutase family protein [Spirosoma taeanense]QJW88411.1 methylmalonyl-CoA mutase [Spirosoma taeanense]